MELRLQDKALARCLKEIIARDTAAKKERRRIFGMSYAKRLKEFLDVHGPSKNEHQAHGFMSWYGPCSSSIEVSEDCNTRLPRRRLSVNSNVRTGLRFSGFALAQYFKAGEDLPCFMRGGLYAMSGPQRRIHRGGAQYHAPLEAFERYLRRIKMTCLYFSEWTAWLESLRGQNVIGRVRKKWDPYNGSYKDHFTEALYYQFVRDNTVLLNGKVTHLDADRLEAVRKLHELSKKIKVNDRTRAKETA